MNYTRANGGAAALAFAREITGYPYIYGGDWPEDGGCDCSDLVMWAYGKVGVSLPRETEDQYREYQVNDRNLPNQVGDLLFIVGDPIDPNPGHVVMYVAPGVCFEAEETGTRIGQYPFDTDAWEFRTRPALALPEPPPPAPLPPARGKAPTSAVKRAGLVILSDVAEAEQALKEGYDLWYWSDTHFVAQVGGKPAGAPGKPITLYVNKKFEVSA